MPSLRSFKSSMSDHILSGFFVASCLFVCRNFATRCNLQLIAWLAAPRWDLLTVNIGLSLDVDSNPIAFLCRFYFCFCDTLVLDGVFFCSFIIKTLRLCRFSNFVMRSKCWTKIWSLRWWCCWQLVDVLQICASWLYLSTYYSYISIVYLLINVLCVDSGGIQWNQIPYSH